MRITVRQLRKLIRESLDAPKRLDAMEVQEYFPEAFEGLVARLGDDPDAEGAVLHGMKFYYKNHTLFTRSWDASLPSLKWENDHWIEASYN